MVVMLYMSQKMKNYYDVYAEYYDENRLSEIPLCYTSKKEKEKPSRFLQDPNNNENLPNRIDQSFISIHVHESGYPLKKAFCALVKHVPELIVSTANSPFLGRKFCGSSMRALYSYAIGTPVGWYRRKSDVIINRNLETVELRVCDTQIISKDVFFLVHLVLAIIDRHYKMDRRNDKLNRLNLNAKRYRTAISGKRALKNEIEELREEILPSLEELGKTKKL